MRKFLSSIAIAAAMVAGASAPAHAVPTQWLTVTLSSSAFGSPVTCTTFDLSGCVGWAGIGFAAPTIGGSQLKFSGSIGGFTFDIQSNTANLPGTTVAATLDSNVLVLRNTNAAAATFTIDVTGYGFTLPSGPDRTIFGSQGGSTGSITTGGSMRADFYADGTNSGLLSNGVGCSAVLSTSWQCSTGTSPWVGGTPFSMRQIQTFTLGAGQDTNATLNETVGRVPEPISTSLVGAALVALALSSRRRASKKA